MTDATKLAREALCDDGGPRCNDGICDKRCALRSVREGRNRVRKAMALSTAPGESEGARDERRKALLEAAEIAERFANARLSDDYEATVASSVAQSICNTIRELAGDLRSPPPEGEHKTIYLEPDCCSARENGRMWCEDDQGPCEGCGRPWVRYVLASTPPVAPAGEAGMRAAILAEAVRACWSVPLFTGALNNRSGAIIKQDCIDAIRALAQETSNG